MRENDQDTLIESIKNIPVAMLTTVNKEGQLRSRPMITIKLNDAKAYKGTLWFFTKIDSFKVHDIVRENEVNLSYANPEEQKYISVVGVAGIDRDPEKMKKLWNSNLSTWFPEGLNDPELGLIKVDVRTVDIWDAVDNKSQLRSNFQRESEFRQ